MKKIGVLLCGCGHRDGSEIHEATLTLLAIDEAGAEAYCMAPREPQKVVRNHLTGEEVIESRDMLIESARIARGNIRDLAIVAAKDIDALIIPGGQGAATNLSSFIAEGPTCTVHREVERLIVEMYGAKKPIGAICIAPGTLAKALQNVGVHAELTLGTDPVMQGHLTAMGHTAKNCPATDCVVDERNRIVTTPAYMLAKNLSELNMGIGKLVQAVVEMIT